LIFLKNACTIDTKYRNLSMSISQ